MVSVIVATASFAAETVVLVGLQRRSGKIMGITTGNGDIALDFSILTVVGIGVHGSVLIDECCDRDRSSRIRWWLDPEDWINQQVLP